MTAPFIDPRVLEAMRMRQGNAPQPGAPQPPAPAPSRSIMDRVFGVPGASGLVDEDVLRRARQQSLLNAGLAIAASGAPAPRRPTIAEGLQAGLQAGQGAYRNTIAEAVQSEQLRQQQEMQKEVVKIRERYRGGPADRQNLANMALEIAAARGELGPMAALLAATKPVPASPPQELKFEFDEKTGKMGAFDPQTGKLVRATQMRPDGTMEALDEEARRKYEKEIQWIDGIEADLRAESRTTRDQAESLGRFLGSLRQTQDAMDRGSPDEAAAAAYALMMAYGKISDPGSVVREFEAAGIQHSGSAVQNVQQFIAKWKDGVFSQGMLNSIAENVAKQVEGQRKVYQRYVDAAYDRAMKRGIGRNRVTVPDLFEGLEENLHEASIGWRRNRSGGNPVSAGGTKKQWWEQ